jgi:hypothetical protein
MGLEDFIFNHPAQVALLGIQFQWTADTQVRCKGRGARCGKACQRALAAMLRLCPARLAMPP